MKYTETEYGEVKKVLEYITTKIEDKNSKVNELYGIAMVNKAICMIETLQSLDESMVNGVETLKKGYPKDMQYLILPVKDGKPLHETMTKEWIQGTRNTHNIPPDDSQVFDISEIFGEVFEKSFPNAEGKVIGLSTVQRGDFIAEGLKEWKGRYREGKGFNKWEPVERKEE